MLRVFPALAVICVLAGAAFAAAPAQAKIRCEGVFQVTKYGLHESPYCSEQTIARVARSYGIRVSDRELHRGDLTKVRLCLRLGHDTRLAVACAPYYPRGRGR